MAGRTSRVSSLHPNEEKYSQKHMSRNEWGLRSTERLYSTINYLCIILLTTDILYLQPVPSFKLVISYGLSSHNSQQIFKCPPE